MADLHRVIKVGILTVSDTCYNGKADDKSGENLKTLVESGKCFKGTVATKDIIHDVQEDIKAKLLHWSDSLKLDVILTTGGTGFAPRDVTPEATKAIIDKEALGMTVAMIKGSLDITPLAMLSRLVCGIRGSTLIINLPGSTKGSAECLQIVAGSITHAVDLLHSDKSNIETTHTALQAQGIKSAHSSDASPFGGYKDIKSKISSSPNLLKHLQSDKKQQSTLTKECVTQFCNRLKKCLEQVVKEATPPNVNFIECHINDGVNGPNQLMNLMTNFVQLLLVSIQDFTHSLGISDQLNSSSLSSQMSKTIESEMKSWIEGCGHKPDDQSVIVSTPMPSDKRFTKRDLRYDNETISTKSFMSQEVDKRSENYCLSPLEYPQCQIESHICQSASYRSSPKRLRKHGSSFETDFYKNSLDSVAVNSNSFSVPNSYKMFHQSCGKNLRVTESLIKTNGSENKVDNVTYSGHLPMHNPILTKEVTTLHETVRKPVQINLLMESKQAAENVILRNDSGCFQQSNCSTKSKEEDYLSVLMSNTSRVSDLSKELCKIVNSSKQYGNNCSRLYERCATDKCESVSDKPQFDSILDDKNNQSFEEKVKKLINNDLDCDGNRLLSPTSTIKKCNMTTISTSPTNSSGEVHLSPSKPVWQKSSTSVAPKSLMSAENKPVLHYNIMSAKIHNVNNQGELVNVSVGKAFNCFVNDHQLLKGISLYKGKRDIKKLLVYLSRQEDVTRQATSWKRGKEVLERNRLDDYFQLTPEGTEEQKQVHCGKKRDQYVVNWYMWCPGHGNCKRKCGGYGKCIENCKGMQHKQDRHNCSLMVNLKLFLSDLSTWRVHITGSHVPDLAVATATTTTTTPVLKSSHVEAQCQLNSSSKETPGRSIGNTLGHQIDQNLEEGKSLSRDTNVTSVVTNAEMNSFLQNVSNNESGNATMFNEKDHDLEQSKMPSKKRISKMLSSLKRRRQNKPYGLLKSRLANSSSTCDNGNGTTAITLSKNCNVDVMTRNDDNAYSGMTSDLVVVPPTSYNQSSLLSEFTSYLPETRTSGRCQGADNILTTQPLSTSTPMSHMTRSTPDRDNTPYSCDITSATKYTNTNSLANSVSCVASHYNLNEDIDTHDMSQEVLDAYHPAISLPNFHQPFLHANSLTEILTEAGVNISEQFDDLNSSINLGSDPSSLSEINQTSETVHESCLPFQSSQHHIVTLPSSSLLGHDSSTIMIPGSHLSNIHINISCENPMDNSAGSLPSYKEATLALAKQKGFSDEIEGSY